MRRCLTMNAPSCNASLRSCGPLTCKYHTRSLPRQTNTHVTMLSVTAFVRHVAVAASGATDKTHCACKHLTLMWKDLVRDCCGTPTMTGDRIDKRRACVTEDTGIHAQGSHHEVWLIVLHPARRAVTRGAVAWLASRPARAGAHDTETCFAWRPKTMVVPPVLANEVRNWCAEAPLPHGIRAHDSGHGIGVRFGSNRKRQQEATSLATDTFHSRHLCRHRRETWGYIFTSEPDASDELCLAD